MSRTDKTAPHQPKAEQESLLPFYGMREATLPYNKNSKIQGTSNPNKPQVLNIQYSNWFNLELDDYLFVCILYLVSWILATKSF